MPLTKKQENTIDGYIFFAITSGNPWMLRRKDWRYGFDSLNPYQASILIRYLLNEIPTKQQRDLVRSYADVEKVRKLKKGVKFRSELLPLLEVRTLLFGNKKFFQNEPPLYTTLNLPKDDVYDYVKSKLIEYLINLGFTHIPQDFVKSHDKLHSPTIQKKPFVLDFDCNTDFPNSILLELPKPNSSYWMPPLLNLTIVFDALYTTFASTMNILNNSIKISLDVIKEWHNHIHQDVLEDELQQPCRTR